MILAALDELKFHLHSTRHTVAQAKLGAEVAQAKDWTGNIHAVLAADTDTAALTVAADLRDWLDGWVYRDLPLADVTFTLRYGEVGAGGRVWQTLSTRDLTAYRLVDGRPRT